MDYKMIIIVINMTFKKPFLGSFGKFLKQSVRFEETQEDTFKNLSVTHRFVTNGIVFLNNAIYLLR